MKEGPVQSSSVQRWCFCDYY